MTNLTRLQNHESGLASRFNALLCTVKQLAAVVIAVLAISSTATAQTFPTNCSSKDLDAIETILQGSTANSLMPGNRKISLTVANKTTSDRRSFVMWAKMNRYDVNGNLKESRNIAFGVDSVKKNSTMTLTSKDSLYFGGDDLIELTNIYTAWSGKNTDDITYLLNKVDMSMGAAFGLFAVFSILRLRTEGLTKHYGGVHALEDATFELRKGEHVAIMGDNGACKSTFVRQITGVDLPVDGGWAML